MGSKNYGTTTFSFWDTQTTGQTISAGGVGKTTAEMKTLSTFTSAGWDFVGESGNGMKDIWRMCEDGAGYPKLNWQFASLGDFICPNGVDSDDLLYYIGQWQRTDCTSDNAYCSGVDLDYSGAVNLADWAIFASHWLGEGYVEPPLPSPGASWKMDETTGIVVSDSVGEYDGQTVNVTGAPWVAGYLNNALKLDGVDDYVDVAGYAGVMGTSSRTCTAWIKANSTGKEQVIMSWGNGANGQKWMFRVQADGKLAVAVWGGYISGSVSVADGQWHHVAAVLVDDGSPSVDEIRLYVDGFPQTVTSSNSQAINTVAGQTVQMGSVYNGAAQGSFFGGLLDEVRIYDVALTGEQILRVAME